MSQQFPISIDSVVGLLGLERSPQYRHGAVSYNVRCPFCDDRKYHLNINTAKNTYNCLHCPGDKTGGGALDLYSRAALGCELRPGKQRDGGNGSIIYKKLAEALHLQNPMPSVTAKTQRKKSPSVRRASDDRLNAAYSALLDFKHFVLTETHRWNLLKRGLDMESIERNGYRSAVDFSWVNDYPAAIACHNRFGLHDILERYDSLKYIPFKQRVAGLIVANELQKAGIELYGVPGFFRLSLPNGKKVWSFRIECGMLIPTRNSKGQIVGLQARKDRGSLRYMTVSSKGLPDAVVEGIARLHFPLANCHLKADTPAILIEGPLKADIVAARMGENAFFLAQQGVTNRVDLPNAFRMLRSRGVCELLNAHDMDKITNPHVSAAGRTLQKLADDEGLSMSWLYWDRDYAFEKYLELVSLCRYHGIPMPEHGGNIFEKVAGLSDKLFQRKISHSITIDSNGHEEKHYWRDSGKGLDDFLSSGGQISSIFKK